jgi:hypothetical protein
MPLIGLNNNVEQNGIVYHIQTEDSGTQNPHIFTHLFHDGVIIATKRLSYEHLLTRSDLTRCIQTLMRWQHRQMYQELTNGTYTLPNLDGALPSMASLENVSAAQLPDFLPEKAPPSKALEVSAKDVVFGARYDGRSLRDAVFSFLQSTHKTSP